MSTTTLRPGARALGALLLSAALVGAPSVASADETPTPTPTPTATATPDPSATPTDPAATPTPTDTPTATPTADPTATPTADPTPSPSSTPTATPSATTAVVAGGDAGRYGVAAVTGPVTSSDPLLVGAHYLEQQLRLGGHVLSVDFGGTLYPDYGVTADAVLALAAAGTGQVEATLATQTLATHFVDYTGFGDPTEVYAGSVAKLLNVAVAQGVDPTAFGGVDLVATLGGLEQPSGRFSDVTKYGDASNTFGQSLALIGLHRAGGTVSATATDYLLAQQCPGGGFQLYMADAGCTDDANADPDATAMAVQALIAVGGHGAAANAGLDYLATRQAAGGGVGGGGPQTAANANSTGLAGQAFLAGGRTTQARAAVTFLTGLQYGCALPAAVRGGIAYDRATYDAKVAAGTSAVPTDPDRRSTSQALLALAGVPLGSVTSAGATAEAPALACAVTPRPTTSTGSPSATTDPTSAAGAGGSGGSTADPVAAAPAGALAQTGADPLGPVLVGLALLVLGVVAVLASRTRRGAHA